MNHEAQILETLQQILDAQRQALANQEKAIAAQQLAFERQAAHLRLYKIVLLVGAPVFALLVLIFFRLAGPFL